MSTDDDTTPTDWRERQKEKRRQVAKKRRAELAANPRVQALKLAVKERRRAAYAAAKKKRKALADERKRAAREQKTARTTRTHERRDAALRARVVLADALDNKSRHLLDGNSVAALEHALLDTKDGESGAFQNAPRTDHDKDDRRR